MAHGTSKFSKQNHVSLIINNITFYIFAKNYLSKIVSLCFKINKIIIGNYRADNVQ